MTSPKTLAIFYDLFKSRDSSNSTALNALLARFKDGFDSSDGELMLVNISDDQVGFTLRSERHVLEMAGKSRSESRDEEGVKEEKDENEDSEDAAIAGMNLILL